MFYARLRRHVAKNYKIQLSVKEPIFLDVIKYIYEFANLLNANYLLLVVTRINPLKPLKILK